MMLRPSYVDLMGVLKDEDNNLTSRYSIVIATAKRARQLVDGQEQLTYATVSDKPVSISIQELYEGHFKLVSDE